jgi:PAS domain S-box-containing protein
MKVPAGALLALFGELTGVMFCAKNAEGIYVDVNDAFVRRTNQRTRAGVIGRRATELFARALAERYEEQDARVLAQGVVLRHELELIRREGGAAGWYLTTKVPVRSPEGAPLGVVSVSEDLRSTDQADPSMPALSRVVELVLTRLDDPPRVEELAGVAGLSVSTLERRMHHVFGLSPAQFVLRARMDHARTLLTETDRPLADIAAACGFYDQPAFTRQFTRLAGETPGVYRRRAP